MYEVQELMFDVGRAVSRISTQAIIALVCSHQLSSALVLEESNAARRQYTANSILLESK
jgi:hypothetical protein